MKNVYCHWCQARLIEESYLCMQYDCPARDQLNKSIDTMERLTQTELKHLQPGDRFYFAGDRKKQTYTLWNEQPFFSQKQKAWTKHYANCINDAAPKHPEPHLTDRRVIFLRNINDPK